jgi:hypothetical protein
MLACSAATLALCGTVARQATGLPITLVPSLHIGWRVNVTTGANVCRVSSRDRCRRGEKSSGTGGFEYLSSIAVDPETDNLYVTDNANERVQELTATGDFVAAFGWNVNETLDKRRHAIQMDRNVCTAASKDACTAGSVGIGPGHLNNPSSIAIGPDGDVYVLEVSPGNFRVDKYTPAGRFVWMIGRGVNAGNRGNVCREREIARSRARCGTGAEASPVSLEPGAFKFAQSYGDLLAVGGPDGPVYIGDEHRVQEFDVNGRWRREILLASLSAARYSSVAALALDASGDLYVVYRAAVAGPNTSNESANVVRKFNPAGEQIAWFAVRPRRANATAEVNGLAVDTRGRLAVIGNELEAGSVARLGVLYEPGAEQPMAYFAGPSDNDGIAFNRAGDLYVAATDDQEAVAYVPTRVIELVASPTTCEVVSGIDPFGAFDCALSLGVPSANGRL